MKSFFKALFTITFFSLITKLLSFILKVYMSRTIGAEGIGVMQVAMSICMVFLTLSGSGINVVISKKTSENFNLENQNKTFSLITASTILSLIISGFSISLILLFSNFIKSITSNDIYTVLLCMLPCLLSSSLSTGINGYFWGRKKHFENSFSEFLEQFLRNILCFILITTASNYVSGAILATLSMTIASIISTIITLILFFKNGGKFVKSTKEDFKYLVKTSLPITMVRFLNSFTHPLIAVIVPLQLENMGFSSSQTMSMFGIIQGMTLPLLLIPMMLISALSTVLIPDLVNKYACKDYKEAQKISNLSITFSIFISSIILPIFMAIGKPIGNFLFNNELCGLYLEKSAWIMIPNSIQAITSATLNVLDQEKKASLNFILSTITLLIFVFILPMFIDILAIPYSMGISMIIHSILNINSINKHLSIKTKISKPLITFCLISIPTYIFTLNLFELLNKFFTEFYSLMLSGCLGFIFYFLICFVFKIIDISFIFTIKNKKNNKQSSINTANV